MKKYLFNPENKFYKANLHCHTTVSDGQFTPAEIKERYMAEGYSIVAYSDHDRVVPHPELMDENFIPLTAGEYSLNDRPDTVYPWYTIQTYHLNFISKDINAKEFLDWDKNQYGVESVNRLIEEASARGYICQYNHPRWSMQVPQDFIGLDIFSFEIYNTAAEDDLFCGDGEYEYELFCRAGGKCGVAANDDNHRERHHFGGFTMVSAPSLTYDNVIKALENGDSYATCGPLIKELYVEDGVLHIKTSPCSRIGVLTDSRCHGCAEGKDMESAEIALDFPHEYIRIVVCDDMGRRAWTRAYFDV
ncbi:MAG: PHP domain-containing protein [Clostridia bacterium]|nr:PHP domain-containing protein [Clostridia bacterium]